MAKQEQDNRAVSDKVARDAAKLHYTALDNETSHMVRELAKAKRFHEVEDALHVYGVYLEMNPDALKILNEVA